MSKVTGGLTWAEMFSVGPGTNQCAHCALVENMKHTGKRNGMLKIHKLKIPPGFESDLVSLHIKTSYFSSVLLSAQPR